MVPHLCSYLCSVKGLGLLFSKPASTAVSSMLFTPNILPKTPFCLSWSQILLFAAHRYTWYNTLDLLISSPHFLQDIPHHISVVFQLENAWESPESLIKTDILAPVILFIGLRTTLGELLLWPTFAISLTHILYKVVWAIQMGCPLCSGISVPK